MIDRYIYQVIKNLPSGNRKDIEEEIRTLISDMLDARTQGGDAGQDDIAAVLAELGNPEELSARYMELPRYLIGPSVYPKYMMVLKTVVFAFAIGMALITILQVAVSNEPGMNPVSTLIDNVFSGAVSAAAWVTIIFAIIERRGINLNKMSKEWKVSDLPPVPDKNTAIKIGGPIVSLVFITLGTIFFIAAPELFSAYITTKEGTLSIIPVFNLSMIRQLMPAFILIFAFGAVKEITSIIERRYTRKMVIITIVCDIIVLVLAVIVFSNSSIWNPDFAAEVNKALGVQDSQVQNIWGTFTSRFVLVIIAFSLIDPFTAIYKSIKYKI